MLRRNAEGLPLPLDRGMADAAGISDASLGMASWNSGWIGTFIPGDMPSIASHDVLVQFAAPPGPDLLGRVLDAVGGRLLDTVHQPAEGAQGGPLLRIAVQDGLSVAEAAALLSREDGVAFAEPDYRVTIAATSNDPTYTSGGLWGMYGDATAVKNAYGSQAGEAWVAGFTGSTKTVVGVVDTGIDYTHIDLYLNVWLNQGEIPLTVRNQLTDTDADGLITFRDLNAAANTSFVADVNGNGRIDAGDLLNDARWENATDEDGNGYRDDLIGWDFVNGDNDPFDDNGHGTHVSGTIGGLGGNGVGVAGVAWNVQIVGLKFLSGSGSGSTSGAIKAIDYFTTEAKNAAPGENFVATNNSWGGGGYSQALSDAIARGASQDILFIAAAGNGGSDGIGDNNDVTANYPSNYNTTATAGYDAVVGVAALTSSGGLAAYSNYGAGSVDLAAPGSGIASTLPGNTYGTYSGTSMATPHVTGAVALYAAANPDATAAQIKAALLASTVATASLAGKTVTGGRLDVMTLVTTGDGTQPPPDPVADEAATITGIYDNAGASTGWLASGATTDDATPTLSGTVSNTLEAGESVAVYRNGARVGTAILDGTNWSFNEATNLADGSYTYTARVEDVSGATGVLSGGFGIIVSTTTGPTYVYGTSGSDRIYGTAGKDVLSGIPATGTQLGRGTIDQLYGGGANDLFVLGDARGLFYNDGSATNAGKRDYAQIMDFQRGDLIQLSDDVGAYFLVSEKIGGYRGTAIYADVNGNARYDSYDELVGHVANVGNLTGADFVFG